jgi:hypothetical protein
LIKFGAFCALRNSCLLPLVALSRAKGSQWPMWSLVHVFPVPDFEIPRTFNHKYKYTVCMCICMYLRMGIYNIRTRYRKLFGAHPKNLKRSFVKQICKMFKQSSSHTGTNSRVRGDCWLESVCIRKVLRPANSIKVFLVPRANAELVHKLHVALHASHAALPMVTAKFRPTAALPMLDQNVTIMQPFQRAKSFTLSQTYLYQKDERALPGKLQNRRKKSGFCPHPL